MKNKRRSKTQNICRKQKKLRKIELWLFLLFNLIFIKIIYLYNHQHLNQNLHFLNQPPTHPINYIYILIHQPFVGINFCLLFNGIYDIY